MMTDRDTSDQIVFQAEIAKVQTLADGGIRVTLNLSESEYDTARHLMKLRHIGAILKVVAVGVRPVLQSTLQEKEVGKVSARSVWQSEGEAEETEGTHGDFGPEG